jgi:phosphoglucomutase/phosphomannomutase
MFPLGCNAINRRTVAETVAAVARYARSAADASPRGGSAPSPDLSAAVGYDPRHQSREFAELAAEILCAHGYQVYFLDGCRSTPLLAFTVREMRCRCGFMITDSHNHPTDNAVKIFWHHGGQVRDPQEQALAQAMEDVEAVERIPFQDGLDQGAIHLCQDAMGSAFVRRVLAYATSPAEPRTIRILYSPLQGVGATSVLPVLRGAGFTDTETFAPHAALDPDCPAEWPTRNPRACSMH